MTEAKKNEKEDVVYSYHTFLFPFIYEAGEDKNIDIANLIDIKKAWCEIKNEESAQTNSLMYGTHQYFTPNANKLAFNSDISKHYSFKYGQGGTYVIKKWDLEYTLNINGIRLDTYPNRVAVLVFELENYRYPSFRDVANINQYGRRINAPFFSGEKHQKECGLIADAITINLSNGEKLEENFLNNVNGKSGRNRLSLTYVMAPIQELLKFGRSKLESVSAYEYKYADLYIQPAIDDRMYVCCAYQNDAMINIISNQSEKQYGYQKIYSEAQRLYEFLFIDTECGSSCQSRNMIYKLLDRHLYDRWIGWGTIHGVTHHSFMMLTTKSGFYQPAVLPPFLTMYVDMAIIGLVQRATILKLSKEAAECVENPDKQSVIDKMDALLEKYISDQNQILHSGNTAESLEEIRELKSKHFRIIKKILRSYNDNISDRKINKLYKIYGEIQKQLLYPKNIEESIQRIKQLRKQYAETQKKILSVENEGVSIKEINDLHTRYIRAQNQILLSEVTVQEQGQELFDMIRDGLYIPKTDEQLKDQIMNLNQLATAKVEEIENEHSERLNRGGFFVGATGLLVVLDELCNHLLGIENISKAFYWGVVLLCVLAYIYRKKIRRTFKSWKNKFLNLK